MVHSAVVAGFIARRAAGRSERTPRFRPAHDSAHLHESDPARFGAARYSRRGVLREVRRSRPAATEKCRIRHRENGAPMRPLPSERSVGRLGGSMEGDTHSMAARRPKLGYSVTHSAHSVGRWVFFRRLAGNCCSLTSSGARRR